MLINRYDGLHVNDTGNYTGSGMDGVNIKQHYYMPTNETPGLTGGPHRTNDTQRDFAVINALSKLIGTCLNVRVMGNSQGLTLRMLPHQLQAIVDVLGERHKKI